VTGVTKQLWDDDDLLLADLADAVRDVGPLARNLADHAHGVYSWRTVDQDLFLASLSFDSSVQPTSQSPSQSRSDPGQARVLVFDAAPLSVELEVMSDQVVGQLIPPAAGDILVETETGDTLHLSADERGFFLLMPPLPQGMVRLRCDTPTGRVVTDWVTL
jgi:hypothetical protein